MKPRVFTSVLLFISAYSPLFLILVVKDWDFKTLHYFENPVVIYILLGVTILSISLLFIILHKLHQKDMAVQIISAKNRSVDIIGYTVPYMVAFFGVDLAKPDDIISLCIFLLVLLMLTISSKAIFLNPILVIAGYGLYDIEYTFHGKRYSNIVISKVELKPGEEFYVRNLTRFLYFITPKETPSEHVQTKT
jgi:hypothetical protein